MDNIDNIDNTDEEFETNTNELELLEFLVGTEYFGINIAKVSEIIIHCDVTHVPSSPDAVEGVFMHRDRLVTVVDLHKVLNLSKPDNNERSLLVVCDFDQLSIAFNVTNVNGIQRLNWSEVEKPPAISGKAEESLATGVAKIEDKIIMILDFEKIVCDMNSGQEFEIGKLEEIEAPHNFDYSRKVIVVEDSIFLSKVMADALEKTGFTNVLQFYNGKEAWDYITSQKGSTNLSYNVAAVISDIEMPQMDGHTLVRLIRSDKVLKSTPIVLFSSLIHDNLRQKGETAGADAQYSRSQLSECIKTVIELMEKER
ncbi:MAG: chemotaxis protein [Oscillospiraceae bacterium]|jgi:two-component system chemotaxis response regulator CheV|nr:chemotaxis protein [Oscillospiraceae bacterium]